MRKLLAVFISFMAFTTFSVAQAPSPAQYFLDEALTTFEERYFGFSQIDFKALDHDANAKLDSVLSSVGDGHTFRLTPIAWAQFVANSDNAPLPMIGLKFAPLPDASALVVTRVREDSPAKLAGISRGDVVWAVNGTSLETLKSASNAVNAITTLEFNKQSITLEFSRGNTERKTVKLEPAELKPWLPSYELRSDGVAIITFYQYLTGGLIASTVHDFVRQAQAAKAKGIILDVRGSGGGSGFESVAAAGAFVEPVGTEFKNIRGKGKIVYQNGEIANSGFKIDNPANWTQPVVVLTNHISRSAAEYMTFFLQAAGRAKVIGEPTAGVLNTSTSIYPLPGGSSLAVTSGRSSNLAGVPHPEQVTPDLVMNDDMAALSQGRDVILEKALELLK
jgi:carboxyl-terminal processing protease